MNRRANYAPVPTDRVMRKRTQPHAIHTENPPGTKLVRKFFKAKHGVKMPGDTAWRWWIAFHPLLIKGGAKRG